MEVWGHWGDGLGQWGIGVEVWEHWGEDLGALGWWFGDIRSSFGGTWGHNGGTRGPDPIPPPTELPPELSPGGGSPLSPPAPSPGGGSELRFHRRHGANALLTNGGRTALRQNCRAEFNDAIVVSNRSAPLIWGWDPLIWGWDPIIWG